MAANSEPSFTPQRKWTIGLNVGLLILLVTSVVLMLNYLSRDYFHRFHLSSQSANPLSSRGTELKSTASAIPLRVRATTAPDPGYPPGCHQSAPPS